MLKNRKGLKGSWELHISKQNIYPIWKLRAFITTISNRMAIKSHQIIFAPYVGPLPLLGGNITN
jgi:hypothetical protein